MTVGRVVHAVAGTLVLLSILLAYAVSPWFLALTERVHALLPSRHPASPRRRAGPLLGRGAPVLAAIRARPASAEPAGVAPPAICPR